MTRRVVLHVGAMKSGTSYLQSQLFANKDLLLERGVLVPGGTWAAQVNAVRHLMRSEGPRWERMVAEMAVHPGTSVVSMEFLGPMRPAAVRRCVAGLAASGAEVEVVVSARDLNRSIPAMWQETVQNGRTWTWEDYLAALTAWRPGHRKGHEKTWAGRTFWRQQNIVRIARTWSRVVGPEHVTLLTVPQPGAPRDLLWTRFASVLGVDPDGTAPATAANESIGAASALALRRLNEHLEAIGVTFHDGTNLRKAFLAKTVLAARRSAEPAVGLPVTAWVEDHAAFMRQALPALGIAVVGDIEELRPVPVEGVDPASIAPDEVAEAALAGLAGLLAARIRQDATDRSSTGDEEPDDGWDPDDEDDDEDDD